MPPSAAPIKLTFEQYKEYCARLEIIAETLPNKATIDKAWRKLALKCHPDKPEGNEDRFKENQNIYAKLAQHVTYYGEDYYKSELEAKFYDEQNVNVKMEQDDKLGDEAKNEPRKVYINKAKGNINVPDALDIMIGLIPYLSDRQLEILNVFCQTLAKYTPEKFLDWSDRFVKLHEVFINIEDIKIKDYEATQAVIKSFKRIIDYLKDLTTIYKELNDPPNWLEIYEALNKPINSGHKNKQIKIANEEAQKEARTRLVYIQEILAELEKKLLQSKASDKETPYSSLLVQANDQPSSESQKDKENINQRTRANEEEPQKQSAAQLIAQQSSVFPTASQNKQKKDDQVRPSADAPQSGSRCAIL